MDSRSLCFAVALVVTATPLSAKEFNSVERASLMSMVIPMLTTVAVTNALTEITDQDWRLLRDAQDEAALAIATGDSHGPLLQQALRQLRARGLGSDRDDLQLAQWILVQGTAAPPDPCRRRLASRQ